jgi:exopolyphosphatase / guanosine-5'-triphosphate,3'-diphosphate pyrophosphatase
MSAEAGAPPPTGRPAPSAVRRAERPLYAAIDLGTNNCRLLIAEPAPAGFRVVDSFSRIVRLGEGLNATGELSSAAMGRTLEALRICADKLRRRRPQRTRFIATQACRAAGNGAAFLKQVRAETGLAFDLISPREEARLAVMGCASLIAQKADAALIVDIGGGSSELSWVRAKAGAAPQIESWVSVPIGVVTLAERFPETAPRPDWYAGMIAHVHGLIEDALAASGFKAGALDGRVHMIGTSGTVTSLAGVYLNLDRYQRHRVDGLWMEADDARAASLRLQSLSHSERASHPCIGPDRADLVLSGCAIFDAILERWPIRHLRVADRGLREGVLIGLMAAKPKRKRGKRKPDAAQKAAS